MHHRSSPAAPRGARTGWPRAVLLLGLLAAGGGRAAELDAIVAPGTVVEQVLGGLGRAEGIAASRAGYLLIADAGNHRLVKLAAGASQPATWREPARGALAIAFDRQGRLLAAEAETRQVTRTEKGGAVAVLAEAVDGRRLVRPAGVLHAIDGSTYFTDAGPPGMVGQVLRDGRVRSVATGLGAPRGLALSADQRTLYVGDAAANAIRVYAIRGDGRLEDGREFARLPAGAGGALGGLVTDLEGDVYAAGPGGVWVFDAAGRHLGTIPVPETPAALSWADDYKTLYITAQGSLYRIKLLRPGTRIH